MFVVGVRPRGGQKEDEGLRVNKKLLGCFHLDFGFSYHFLTLFQISWCHVEVKGGWSVVFKKENLPALAESDCFGGCFPTEEMGW